MVGRAGGGWGEGRGGWGSVETIPNRSNGGAGSGGGGRGIDERTRSKAPGITARTTSVRGCGCARRRARGDPLSEPVARATGASTSASITEVDTVARGFARKRLPPILKFCRQDVLCATDLPEDRSPKIKRRLLVPGQSEFYSKEHVPKTLKIVRPLSPNECCSQVNLHFEITAEFFSDKPREEQ